MGSIPIASTSYISNWKAIFFCDIVKKTKPWLKDTIHMIKKFLLFFICLFSVSHAHMQTSLILKKKHREWFYDGNKINKSSEENFQKVIIKWQSIVEKLWSNIIQNICAEFGISEEDFFNLINEKEVQELYRKLKPEDKSQIGKNYVTSSIKHALRQHTNSKCSVVLFDSEESIIETFGLLKSHQILCNINFFSPENITYMHQSYPEQGMYYSPDIDTCIDIKHFLLLNIAIGASYINHNVDFFSVALNCFTINDKSISEKTVAQFEKFTAILSILEAILQSLNPLEAAIFIRETVEPSAFEEQEKMLWSSLIQDLELCYNQSDLRLFYTNLEQNMAYIKTTQAK